MPTATSISQFALTNWGPLTTAFTADPACATSTGILQVGLRNPPGDGIENPDCALSTVGSCFPSGTKLDQLASSVFTEVGHFAIAYFSPGLVCPSGWTTAGAVVKSADGSVSTSGIFAAPPGFTATGRNSDFDGPIFNPIHNVFTAAIDPGETAIACCPRSVCGMQPNRSIR